MTEYRVAPTTGRSTLPDSRAAAMLDKRTVLRSVPIVLCARRLFAVFFRFSKVFSNKELRVTAPSDVGVVV